jgi:phosphoglycerate dehydrogenase-like enzyme
MYSTSPPTVKHIDRLQSLKDDLRVTVVDSEQKAIENAPNTQIILGHRYLWQVLPCANSLEWVQSSAAGINHLLVADLWKRQPLLTRSPIFSDIIAWHALALALAVMREIKNYCSTNLLQYANLGGVPRVALVFGLGEIGKELVNLLRGLGLTVIGVNRSGKSPIPCDQIITPKSWQNYLDQVDWLFLCAPLTEDTHQVIDDDVLTRLPKTAVIINVARGGLINHSALINRLEQEQLAGAGLDVIDTVTEEQLFKLQNLRSVIITPKIASFCPERQLKFEGFVESQVQRYLEKKPLAYLVKY